MHADDVAARLGEVCHALLRLHNHAVQPEQATRPSARPLSRICSNCSSTTGASNSTCTTRTQYKALPPAYLLPSSCKALKEQHCLPLSQSWQLVRELIVRGWNRKAAHCTRGAHRCVSRTASVSGLRASTTRGPMVMSAQGTASFDTGIPLCCIAPHSRRCRPKAEHATSTHWARSGRP